ncbi:MAG: molecular chaperone DnaJ [Cenarchaeum symbiont of Oopsacas minuta]|nr:molecular chaperone DnaJ [Cenarchaeum symbiont of Oopsacas minuta]
MQESNYDILGISENASKKEIQEAFRRLALLHHADRGGNEEQFKKIKQSYEDIKQGKKYPAADSEKKQQSRVYSGDDEEETRRRNHILAEEISEQMKLAQEWTAAISRANSTGRHLFGSKVLGEMEFEIKANGTLSIKGNMMAGNFEYNGSIIMQGNITSPTFSDKNSTNIIVTKGDFTFIDPHKHKYKIANGTKVTVKEGHVKVGNIFGRKYQMQDPEGRVGYHLTKEQRTIIKAPNGHVIAENLINTVYIDADIVTVLNMEDDVVVRAREIHVYGNKITYDVVLELKKNGSIQFMENYSILSLSDDAIIKLENGKTFRLRELKIRKISDIPEEFLAGRKYGIKDTMIGNGFVITYNMLDNFEKRTKKPQIWNKLFRKYTRENEK